MSFSAAAAGAEAERSRIKAVLALELIGDGVLEFGKRLRTSLFGDEALDDAAFGEALPAHRFLGEPRGV